MNSLVISTQDSRTITRKSRSNFSGAFLFLPPEKRRALERVYAFFRVVDDIVDEDPDLDSQIRGLSTWKEALIQTYEGKPRFPLLTELKESIDRFQIPREYFLKLIEGCEMDLTKKRYQNFQELHDYCTRVASMVGLVCMRIFEHKTETSDEAAINLGLALQLTNIIRDVGVDLDKGRLYLPLEDLEKFGVKELDLMAHQKNTAFLNLMEFQFQRAERYYELGFLEFKKNPKRLLAATIMGQVYRSILKKIKSQGYPVLKERVSLSPFEKMGILIRVLINAFFSK